MASYHQSSSIVLLSLICLISSVQSYNNGGVTIDMIHRDSPLSPSHDPSKTQFERLRNAFDRSFSRKSSLLLKSLKFQPDAKTTEAPITTGGGAYLIEYKIGTPPVRQLSIADTGSDLTWIQCKPCTKCYKQDYPPFDPVSTKSYRPLSCHSNLCTAGESTSCSHKKVCNYKAYYGDGSYSQGELAAETLTLGTTPFTNFVFGCGNNNAGSFNATESGIFGLGNGATSFIKQHKSSVKGRFSYCLTSLDSTSPSKISFGNHAVVTGANVVSTPLLSTDQDIYYYLILKGISVGTHRLEYNSVITNQQPGSAQGNIIIDSGTTLTFVPSDMYEGIEQSFKHAINVTRVIDPQGTFSLCYKSRGKKITSPPVTLHFKGADVVLPQGNIFVELEKGVFCLSLVPSQDLAVFGNLHQVGYLIGYDLVNKKLNFLKTDCAKSR